MKISRNELRRMILESVLKEQDGAQALTIKDRIRAARKKRQAALKDKKEKTTEPAPAAPSAPAAPAVPAVGVGAAQSAVPKVTKKKASNEKIKQVQRLLNSFLEDSEKIKENGFWTANAVDPAMEKVMKSFGIQNPERSWVKMAQELESKPTLQGLIGFLIKKDKERTDQQDNKNKSFVSSSLTAQKDESKPDDNTQQQLKYPSDGKINYATSDDIKLNTALLIGLFGSFPASGAPKGNPNKPWNQYTEEEVKNMRDTILRLKTDLKGKNKKELAIEFLQNNIDYGEVKERPDDDIRKANWNNLLTKIESAEKPFDLDGLDYQYPEGIQASLKAAVKDALKESKVTYGKSHATLIRERYWGRY